MFAVLLFILLGVYFLENLVHINEFR